MTIALALITLISSGTQAASEPRLMHYPTISGDKLVFSYAGDLWESGIEPGSVARRLTSSPGVESMPHISPDGKTIAFTANYDGSVEVYTMPIEGGEPTRLTYGSDPSLTVGWTPDGKIAYTSDAGSYTRRNRRLWLIDPKGGLPISTPLDQVDQASFMSDGKTIVYQRVGSNNFNWRRYRGGTQGRISLYTAATNTYSELPSQREQSYYPMVVGRSIYYITDRESGTLNLHRYDLDKKQSVQLTKFTDSDIKRPSTDGKSIVFERDAYLYRYDIATAKVEKLTPQILSDNVRARPALRNLAANISDVSLSPSGLRIAVEARGEIFSVPATSGDTRNLTNSPKSRERMPAWSPDGKVIAYESDETGENEIYTKPAKGGPSTRLTTGAPKSITGFTWSPDSKMIVMGSRDGTLTLLDVATKVAKTIDTGWESSFHVSFSPDSKYLAFLKLGKNRTDSAWIYQIATAKSIQVTDGLYNDSDIVFDQGGKYLYLLSERTFTSTPNSDGGWNLFPSNATRAYILPLKRDASNPLIKTGDEEPATEPDATNKKPEAPKPDEKPGATKKPEEFSIDFDGLGDRAIPLPWPAGNYFALISAKNGVFVAGQSGLQKFDLTTKASTTILAAPLPALSLNEARTKLAYLSGGRLGIVDVQPNANITAGTVDLSGVEAIVDPRAEWKQIFWEAWRWTRDNFYDTSMRGLDWNAIGKRYEAYLPYVNHRNDLNETIGLMIGELGTGHSYVGGGEAGSSISPVPTAALGADYVADHGKVKFQKIYRGFNAEEGRRGPLGEPGIDVKEGEYLLAIDGSAVDSTVNPASLLINKVDKFVTLTVNSKPIMDGSRTVRVRPVANEGELRYADWVETRRQMVNKLSGGRIGYMHVTDTSGGGAEGFIRGFYSQQDKDALVVDERNNSGGNLPWFFVEKLSRKNQTFIQQRHGPDVPDSPAIAGPKVMLINENSGSGGDMFPFLFRQAKLGPLVGKRTWGGLVGIGASAPLVDGGFLTAPEFSIYNPQNNEIVAENQGIDPDVDIDNRPDQTVQGRDPQLERAVEILMSQLKNLPPQKERKDLPKVGKNGRIGG